MNGDSRVSHGDIGNIQSHLGEGTISSNFRDEINGDGRINNQNMQVGRADRGESCGQRTRIHQLIRESSLTRLSVAARLFGRQGRTIQPSRSMVLLLSCPNLHH